MVTHNKKPTRKTILIVVEGYCEEIYFRSVNQYYRKTGISVLRAKHSDSNSILKIAINESKKKVFDCIYCVYDTDTLENSKPKNFKEIMQVAIDRKIIITESNPCFELWLLLHHQTVHAVLNSKQTIDQLKKYYEDYCKEQVWHLKLNLFEKLMPQLELAINRAKKLTEQDESERSVYSKIYTIFEKIIEWNKT